jgi:hypothetical protein
MSQNKRAIIIAQKNISSAPRILKEIKWLSNEGWMVDTLGLGRTSPANGRHIEIQSANAVVMYLSYFVRLKHHRFRLLYERFLPKNLSDLLSKYDLVIIHEPTLFPSLEIQRAIESRNGVGVHVDLHEDHINSLSRNALEKFAFETYRKWEVDHMVGVVSRYKSNLSVSSVTPAISKVFESTLGVDVSTVRNTPEGIDLAPSPVDFKRIRLVHHGVGTTHRGIEESIFALSRLPRRFELNFHLVSGPMYLLKLRFLVLIFGVARRVNFHNPVPTERISQAINEYDIALVVIPPITENELNSLPNKFLESIQARLALVIGPNPLMAEIVKSSSLGVVLDGWKSIHITKGLLELSSREIEIFKENSALASYVYSSEKDRKSFFTAISRAIQ